MSKSVVMDEERPKLAVALDFLRRNRSRREPRSFVDYYCFFIVFFPGFFSPVFMGIIFMDIIFFIFLNCSSVKIVRISFMAFNISK